MNRHQKNSSTSEQKTREQMKDILHPEQSLELLKALHVLTRDGAINQDSRRKLKQIYHLYRFFEPILKQLIEKSKNEVTPIPHAESASANVQHKMSDSSIKIIDHGAGKSYLGFILYDLFFKSQLATHPKLDFEIWNIEAREQLIESGTALAKSLDFPKMKFLKASIGESIQSTHLPQHFDLVCALHACDTATDEAIDFAIEKKAQFVVLVPCCQAEVCRSLNQSKAHLKSTEIYELFRHPLHTREFGSHLTNVLRCLRLEAMGYKVTVTEFTGLEHSMKNELIIAELSEHVSVGVRAQAKKKLQSLIGAFAIEDLTERFRIS